MATASRKETARRSVGRAQCGSPARRRPRSSSSTWPDSRGLARAKCARAVASTIRRMHAFETLIGLLLVAITLAAVARRIGAPYPALLAIGGALLAFVPGVPVFSIPPDLALALFVAPVLLDAAFDASPRDLRENWVPVASLVVVSVLLTTMAVAVVARMLVPAMPWAAAVALGAVVAPPDATAAIAV